MFGKKRPKFGPGEIIILIVIGILLLIVVTGNYQVILKTLLGPYTAFVAVMMLVEYLILKGSDRSDIYRRELEAARNVRRDDLLALRDMETRLLETKVKIAPLAEAGEDCQELRTALGGCVEAMDQVLELVRKRI
jgi:hypothetical protein